MPAPYIWDWSSTKIQNLQVCNFDCERRSISPRARWRSSKTGQCICNANLLERKDLPSGKLGELGNSLSPVLALRTRNQGIEQIYHDLSYTNYWYYCKTIQIFGESNGELHITAWHTLTHYARWAWSFGLTLGFRTRNAAYKVMNLRGKFELDECRASRPTNIFAPPSAIILEQTSPPTPIEKNWATEEQKGTMGSHFRPARSQLDFPEFWLPEPWVGNTNHGLLHRTGVQLLFIPSSAQKFDSTQVGKHITLWSGWLFKEASALDTASALHCISNMNTAWSCFYKADWSM